MELILIVLKKREGIKMEKKSIKKEIILKTSTVPFKWKDVKDLPFEDNEEIDIEYIETWHYEDGSEGPLYQIISTKIVMETDEEFEKRKKAFDDYQIISKKQRFEQFLKLREEFDAEVKKIKNG